MNGAVAVWAARDRVNGLADSEELLLEADAAGVGEVRVGEVGVGEVGVGEVGVDAIGLGVGAVEGGLDVFALELDGVGAEVVGPESAADGEVSVAGEAAGVEPSAEGLGEALVGSACATPTGRRDPTLSTSPRVTRPAVPRGRDRRGERRASMGI